jgi:hypothetical protein
MGILPIEWALLSLNGEIFRRHFGYLRSTGVKEAGDPVFDRLFLDHPRSVGESYLEHQRHALGFGMSLLGAALACLVHALIPGLFVRTGSEAITRLHDRMVVNRAARDRARVISLRT